MVELHLG
ncbi:hypothetical protein FWK35_00023330 [Aphis craccivora]|nr:hypothetical protein FWK35_00023330 [Aphis craccivora]